MASSSVQNLNSCSILNTISLREIGNLRNKLYQNNIINFKLKHEPQKPHLIVDLFGNNACFEYVRPDSSGNLIGVSFYRSKLIPTNVRPSSCIYLMKFDFNPSCVKGHINCNSLLSSFQTKKTLGKSVHITDTADVHINGKDPILFAGIVEEKWQNQSRLGMAGLTYFNCEGRNLDCEWRVQGQAFCCTTCDFTQQYALGCEGGYYLFNTIRMKEKCVMANENVLSLQFSNDGNFLVISSDRGGVSICDVREHACYRKYCAIKQDFGASCNKHYTVKTISPQITEVKLLKDQTSIICVNPKGSIEKVDTRMRKTVFQYQGHQEHDYRRSLCLNEELDLVCAPGKDKVVRIWSLSSGKLNCERNVSKRIFYFNNNEPPHCCFVSNQRRWFLSVIQDNYLIPVVPNDEFLDISENDKAPVLCESVFHP